METEGVAIRAEVSGEIPAKPRENGDHKSPLQRLSYRKGSLAAGLRGARQTVDLLLTLPQKSLVIVLLPTLRRKREEVFKD